MRIKLQNLGKSVVHIRSVLIDVVAALALLAAILSPFIIVALSGLFSPAGEVSTLIAFSRQLRYGGQFAILTLFIAGTVFILFKAFRNITHGSMLKSYVIIGLGSILIPINSAAIVALHYGERPYEYLIDKEISGRFAKLQSRKSDEIKSEIFRYKRMQGFLDSLEKSVANSSDFIAFHPVKDRMTCLSGRALPLRDVQYLAHNNQVGRACIYRFKDGDRWGAEDTIFQLISQAGDGPKEILLNFTSISMLPGEPCPIYRIFGTYRRRPVGVQRSELEICLNSASRQIRVHLESLDERQRQISSYIPFTYGQILVNEVAVISGSDFRLLKPIGIWAGIISSITMIAVAGYFVIFLGALVESGRRGRS